MSNSLDFCKTTAIERSGLKDRDWSNPSEIDSKGYFDVTLKGMRQYTISSEDGSISYNVNISFDPDGDFQYFTTEVAATDGTLIFVYQLMNNCINKVIAGQTYYGPSGPYGDKDTISYTVGNFIIISEVDDKFAPKDKPWCTNRVTVMLPLKYQKET